MIEVTPEIPTSWYVIIGSLIVANIGSIVSVIYGVGRAIWWASKVESRLTQLETEHTKDLNEAFMKIRHLETKGGL